MRFTFPSNAPRTIELLTRDEPGVVRDFERHADALANWLEGREWLVGDALSLADIAVFAQMFCIRGTVEGGQVVSARPGVAKWMDRVEAATLASTARP